jgi:hypothetical protein
LPVFLLVTLGAAIVLGIGLIVASEEAVDPTTLEQALLRDLGLAFLVAGFLGSSFELVQRVHLMRQTERAIERIRKEQITQTLRSLVSPSVFEEIEDHIIKRPLLREHQNVTLVLDWADEKDRSHVKSRCTSQYKIRNLTQAPVTEKVTAFCSKYLHELYPEGCKIHKVSVGARVLEGSSIPVAETDEHIRYEETETIPPSGDLDVECCYEGVHHSRDVWVWVFTQMTERFEVTIKYPAGLEVEAEANHPRAEQRFRLSIDEVGLRRWELDAAALPYQSVQVAWDVAHPTSKGGAE